MSRSSNNDSCNGPFSASAWIAGARRAVSQSSPAGLRSLLDARLGDHPAVADQHHPAELEAAFELGNLRRQCVGIADIAVEHFDRHRAAIGGAEQAIDDLQLARLAVAAIAVLRQWATAALEIARGQIVEHQ